MRVLILLSLALMPLGAIGFWQSQRLAVEAPRQARATLLSLTELAANPLQAMMQRGFGAATALAPAVLRLRDDPAACSAYLAGFVERSDTYDHAAFLDRTGRSICTSDGRDLDLSDDPALVEGGPMRSVTLRDDGTQGAAPRMVVTDALLDAEGDPAGFLSLALPDQTDAMAALRAQAGGSLSLATFNVQGEVLTASQPRDTLALTLPEGRALRDMAVGNGRSFLAPDVSGEDRVYAVVPIVPGIAYALSSAPRERMSGGRVNQFILTALMPLLMWLASLLVAFLALERLVFRHIRALGRQMRAFARTRRTVRAPVLDRAGAELGQIEADFREMAQAIMQDEAQLEDNLREKNILLKEVHHRVKNNLQLISSIMNMQARKLTSPEARDVLRRVQDRVMGLAAVHRSLYQTEDIGRIDAGAMVADLSRQIAASASGEVRVSFEADVQPVHLDPDRAVALSLAVSELMTNAVAHVARLTNTDKRPWIRLSLAPLDETHARLRVANSSEPEMVEEGAAGGVMTATPKANTTGLGTQLIRAFAHQLDGEVKVERTHETHTLDLVFPIETYREDPRDY